MKKIIAAIVSFCFIANLSSQDLSLYQKKELIRGKDTLRYRILYPQNYKKHKAYPLIVFLHGSGERGRDNEAQLKNGGALFLKEIIRSHFPAIVVFPQCPSDSAWSRSRRAANSNQREYLSAEEPPVPQQLVKMLMDSLAAKRLINTKRVYSAGFPSVEWVPMICLAGIRGIFPLRSPYAAPAIFPGSYKMQAMCLCGSSMALWIPQCPPIQTANYLKH
jgi:poly(3-hydroxybutyrate) depolymerase